MHADVHPMRRIARWELVPAAAPFAFVGLFLLSYLLWDSALPWWLASVHATVIMALGVASITSGLGSFLAGRLLVAVAVFMARAMSIALLLAMLASTSSLAAWLGAGLLQAAVPVASWYLLSRHLIRHSADSPAGSLQASTI
jgi:hypothetical protein